MYTIINLLPSNIRMQLLVITAILLGMSQLYAAHPEFKKADSSFVFFKAIKGGKYPYMMTCRPALNQWDMVLCGHEYDEEYFPALIEKADDLVNLVPLRHTVKFADGGLQMDKKLEGYRHAQMAICVEVALKLAGLMSRDEYKGTMLVDEYLAGLPMKWVLSTTSELDALIVYLSKNFVEAGITPPAKKPLLLLNVIDQKTGISQESQDFLTTYFEMLDPYDPEIKEFFDAAQERIDNMMDATKDAKLVGETMGDTIMRKLESESGDFEVKKIVLTAIELVVIGYALSYVKDFVINGAKGLIGLKDAPKPSPATSADINTLRSDFRDLARVLRAAQNPRP